MYTSVEEQKPLWTQITEDEVDISIVIPCLNEAETITNVVLNAMSALEKIRREFYLSGEVIVADNGSNDGSIELSKRAGARVVKVASKGYGAAIRGGVEGSSARFVIMGDADGAHDFQDAIPMIDQLLKGSDLCMGSRFKGHITKGSMPLLNRYVGNPLLTGILNLFFGSGMSDAHCGLRAFTRDAFNKLKLNSPGMEFASEMLIKSSLLKMKCAEVAITQHVDGRGREPHLRPIRDGWRHLKFMLTLAPTWLFFTPSVVFTLVGLALYFMLLKVQSGVTQSILGMSFGDHWTIVAAVCLSLGHSLFVVGTTSYLYSVSRGYRVASRNTRILRAGCKLERMFLQSAFMLSVAVGILALVFSEWKVLGFEGLNAIRLLSLVGTLFLIGVQHFFAAFLFNLIDE